MPARFSTASSVASPWRARYPRSVATGHRLLAGVHDHEAGLGLVQLEGRLSADPTHSRHDHMSRELPDAPLHSAPPHGIGQADADQILHDHTQRVEQAADAGERQKDREQATGRGEGLDLAITDRGDRGHGHEERVHPGPVHVAPQPVIAQRADDHDREHERQGQKQPDLQGPDGGAVGRHRGYASTPASAHRMPSPLAPSVQLAAAERSSTTTARRSSDSRRPAGSPSTERCGAPCSIVNRGPPAGRSRRASGRQSRGPKERPP